MKDLVILFYILGFRIKRAVFIDVHDLFRDILQDRHFNTL